MISINQVDLNQPGTKISTILSTNMIPTEATEASQPAKTQGFAIETTRFVLTTLFVFAEIIQLTSKRKRYNLKSSSSFDKLAETEELSSPGSFNSKRGNQSLGAILDHLG